ncbi:MAG TPA: hypothetical protein ENF18_00685 [candidate division WOR-3 bacterium]|uniref:Uncharacterized protein n=1 Tax=candidate division WOR-3 bacterium TaxID=2052148 RepID=A0A7C0ZBK0_UNCW3|nr:hypothetical protein [candidate division WOR-3 bacterium]
MKETNFNIKVGDTFELKKAYGLADGYIFKGEVKVIRIYGEGRLKIYVLSDGKRNLSLLEEEVKEHVIDGYVRKDLTPSPEQKRYVERVKKRLEEWEKSLPDRFYRYGGKEVDLGKEDSDSEQS